MQSVYEDKVNGKIPEDICLQFLTKYETERKELQAIVAEIEERSAAEKKDQEDVEEFIRRLKKYADVQDLTRELCLELIGVCDSWCKRSRSAEGNSYLL